MAGAAARNAIQIVAEFNPQNVQQVHKRVLLEDLISLNKNENFSGVRCSELVPKQFGLSANS